MKAALVSPLALLPAPAFAGCVCMILVRCGDGTCGSYDGSAVAVTATCMTEGG